MIEKKKQMKPYPLGAHCEEDSIRFAFVSSKESCGIILYDRETGKKIRKIPFLPEEKMGKVYCKYVTDIDAHKISYHFYEEDRIVADEYARVFVGKHSYGKERQEKELKAAFSDSHFDWEGTANPKLPYEKCLCYCMHVRGFTRHPSSGVEHRGTFLGVVEKLDYLKEIGVTTVELQPAYEFTEMPTRQELRKEFSFPASEDDMDVLGLKKLNYWGYKKGYYYAPKAAYAYGEDASEEFKTLVREFHKNGMEIVMQFYFPKNVSRREILDILHFWVIEYHVDGFHLMGENLPISMIAMDDALADTKLWYYGFNTGEIYDKDETLSYCNLAEYQDDYLYTMRRFLKGDADMLSSVLYHMRHIPDKAGRIHYMSNYYGFTLMDMVSYDYKHNEANGESNRDGNDYNCSWNCGEEGSTRKKKIRQLRIKQLKNAMSMLLLTNSTPLIFMGDEFGNSQQGNNNPYCQDNKVTWLDWRELEHNQELYQFWKRMVMLRKEHPILSPSREFRIMDYISCGYPDLSYHGQNAWRPQLENYNRHVGMMYCGKYVLMKHGKNDDFFYIAINMHWESHELALPKLPKGMKWKLLYATNNETDNDPPPINNTRRIAERSISVYWCEAGEADEPTTKKVEKKRRLKYNKKSDK